MTVVHCRRSTAMLLKDAILLLVLLAPIVIDAVPYMLLTNSRAKCVTIAGTRDTTYTIAYHCPDMITMAQDPDDTEKTKEAESEDPNIAADQASKRYAERYKKKLEAMKTLGKGMRDMNIVTKTLPTDKPLKDADYYRRRNKRNMQALNAGTGRTRTELTEKHGNYTYETGDSDGSIEICVQSISAKVENPSRFSLKISAEATISTEEERQIVVDDVANRHVSRMRADLQGIDRKLKNVMMEADKAKDQEISFHSKSVAMSRSTLYWPAVHIIVFLVTGYIQMSTMVKFFKRHHIM